MRSLRRFHLKGTLVLLAAALLVAALAAAPAGAVTRTVFEGSVGSPGGGATQFGSGGPGGLATSIAGKGGAGTGDLYAADTANNRIQQLDSEGAFIRAFGYDVVASGQDNTGVNEQQTVTVPASVSAGTFTLTITSATGLGSIENGSNLVKAVGVSSGAFKVGDLLTSSGSGIPAGTTILEVKPGELKLSATATFTASARALTASETTAAIAYNAEAASGAGSVKERLEALPVIGAGNVTVSGGPGAVAPFTVTFSGGLLAHNDVAQMSATSTLTGGVATVATAVAGGGIEVCKAVSTPSDVCKAGTALAAAGAMDAPQGIAIDQANGNLYLSDQGNRRIDVFSATGAFQGAFGWGVATGATALQFCTASCLQGSSGANAGQFGAELGNPAVDPSASPAPIYVASKSNRRVDEFVPTLSGSTVTGATFLRAIGQGVATGAAAIEECTATCLAGSQGTVPGAFDNSSPISVAVDAGGALYAVDRTTRVTFGGCTGELEKTCRVVKFNAPVGAGPGKGPIEEFAPAELTRAGNPFAFATQSVAIDAASQNLLAAQANASQTKFIVKELDRGANLLGTVPPGAGAGQGITTEGGVAGGIKGLATGPGGRMYVANSNFKVDIFGPPPPPTVTPPTVEAIGPTSATFKGTVTPPPPTVNPLTSNLDKYPTSYRFEYSLDGLSWTRVPAEDIAVGDGSGAGSPNSCPLGNPPSCTVSRTVKGLLPSSTYQVRLVATTGSEATSDPVTVFTTKAAPPTVSGMTANPVTQTTAKLIGFVNPNGEATSYRFEWGADTSYGKQIPAEIEAFAGSGSKAVKVSANLTGLSPNTAYHFRVVAANSAGETVGADQEVLTLNGAALPSNRRYELVSPADKRPQGAVETIAPELLAFQAAADGDSFAYPIIGGLADSTAGGHVEYMARRGPSGWQSTQVSTPSTVSTPISRRVWPSTPKYLSDDLSCAILETHNPASADTPPADVELGVTNLYRWNADGTYTLLTNTVPRNPSSADAAGVFYPVAGASVDCKRVFFKTDYKFLPGASSGLYEWQETGAGGVLRDAGLRPDGSVPPKPYGEGNEVGFGGVVGFDKGGRFDLSQFNSVSPSGRAFFSATSNAGKDSGSLAVFMREPNGTVVDVSQSQTANAALGARYETASPDGSHVFFLGSYGRTAVPGNETMESCTNNTAAAIGKGAACGLYDYDAEAKTLKDLTATTDPANSKGAAVEGVVAVDEDGSHVYFAALGQLLADQGKTYNQNKSSASVNIYLAASGALAYVATIPSGDLARSLGPAGPEVAPGLGANLMRARGAWTAQTTPDGSRLLFTSTGNVSGYESGGAVEAYLYSAGSGATACVSCRTDGAASVASGTAEPIRAALSERQRDFAAPRSLSADGSRVFFEMPDALAPGATEGKRNLYEWRRGVVQWLATLEGDKSLFLGASEDGEDAFIVTQAQLDPHDFDFNRDVYDIKAGGGFPPPEPAPVPCDPAADQCQAPPTLAPGAGTPPSIGASGPGNPPVKQPQKKKHKKKGKQHKKHAHGRAANRNRGGAK